MPATKIIDIRVIERQSKATQVACDEALRLCVGAVEFARETHKSIAAMGDAFEESATFELRELAATYAKIATLADEYGVRDPETIRVGVELLEIIP